MTAKGEAALLMETHLVLRTLYYLHATDAFILSFFLSPGPVPGRAGELGELDPLGVRRGLRQAPRQDGHPAPPAGGDLQAREGHRGGE